MNEEQLESGQIEHIDDTYSQIEQGIQPAILWGVGNSESIGSWLRKFRENWFPYTVVFIATGSFTAVELLGLNSLFGKKIAHPAGICGTSVILAATLWTTLGANLSSKEKEKLKRMADNNALDPKEIVRMYIANSNFATTGAILVIIGSLLLVIDLLTAP
ncbi:hypothetical protein [Burkholderia ubonensis]|uniref:hypothetical protein n=1 Tax=Burkholderia ubonensis TaxID=101571 RepID=UPI0012F91453|nr:hypothetical protein [Burkholderia ubonensis]